MLINILHSLRAVTEETDETASVKAAADVLDPQAAIEARAETTKSTHTLRAATIGSASGKSGTQGGIVEIGSGIGIEELQGETGEKMIGHRAVSAT